LPATLPCNTKTQRSVNAANSTVLLFVYSAVLVAVDAEGSGERATIRRPMRDGAAPALAQPFISA